MTHDALKRLEALADDFAAALDEQQQKNPYYKQDLASSLSFLAGTLFLRRKLKKLGLSKQEQFLAFSLISALWGVRSTLIDVRRELRKLNAADPV